MKLIELLDNILLGSSVVEDFMEEYNKNTKFKSWLNNITDGAVDNCVHQDQKIVWHLYPVMEHILHACQSMNFLTTQLPADIRRLLAYVMFFHDIGKPKCHRVRTKNGESRDSFWYHNFESSRIVKKTAHNFGFNADETKIMAQLVFDHDIFMSLTQVKSENPHLKLLTEEIVKQEIVKYNQFGDGIFWVNCLVLVGISDSSAQNPEMTINSFKILQQYGQILDKISNSK